MNSLAHAHPPRGSSHAKSRYNSAIRERFNSNPEPWDSDLAMLVLYLRWVMSCSLPLEGAVGRPGSVVRAAPSAIMDVQREGVVQAVARIQSEAQSDSRTCLAPLREAAPPLGSA